MKVIIIKKKILKIVIKFHNYFLYFSVQYVQNENKKIYFKIIEINIFSRKITKKINFGIKYAVIMYVT